MPRYISPPPHSFDISIVQWLGDVYEALVLLEDLVVTRVSAARTIRPEESGLVLIDNSGAINVTLPDPVVVGEGWNCRFLKKSNNAHAVTLVGTIDGASNNSDIDAQYDSIHVLSTGGDYVILSQKIA